MVNTTKATKTNWTLDGLRIHREAIMALAARHGASNVRVFGSVARGEADMNSDVDFLVSAKPGTSVFEMVGLWREMQDMLGCEVSLITDGLSDPNFLQRITREAVPL